MITYFATKYDSARDEILHTLAMDWFADWSGEVDASCGSYCGITVEDIYAHDITEAAHHLMVTYGVHLSDLLGHYLLDCNDRGFCGVSSYDSATDLQRAVDDRQAVLDIWYAQEVDA